MDGSGRRTDGWAQPVLKLLREQPKSVAVPALVDLDLSGGSWGPGAMGMLLVPIVGEWMVSGWSMDGDWLKWMVNGW
eukprot:Skav203368  [mRNA]  locus=scaffold940:345372:345884:- [translate_table: standard]